MAVRACGLSWLSSVAVSVCTMTVTAVDEEKCL